MNPNLPPISYSHFQPPPQPIHFPYAQSHPQHNSTPYGLLPASYPAQLEQLQQRASQISPMTNFAPLNIGNPFNLGPASKNVGLGQDFQLFGPSDPLGGIGAGIASTGAGGRDDHEAADEIVRRQMGSIDSSAANTVPDLISDRGSPSIDSPPSPAFAPSRVSPLRPPLPSSTSNGSYRGEGRASSVPPPEFPRPIRRKTQENHHWPSFVSSGSSSSSSSSNYLPTPSQYPQSTLPFVDEPTNYALPPPVSSDFDAASLSLSPAAQYPYSYQAPHTDHPLLPSEQSDLLDRVRRDLLDVDLSSIKGPLRALALSGGEGTPGQFTMMNPLPSYSRYHGGGVNTDRDKTPTPRTANVLSPRSPAISALAHSESARASSIGTVSPQEAFLDYPAVDSKLHDLDPKDGRLARSDFGVGVGHSLFAPLPTTTSKKVNKVKPATPHASKQQHQSTSSNPTRPHAPHPFSVPQNAVSWATRRSNSGRHLVGGVVDGDADDDDGDFGEPSSSTEVTAGEEDEEAEEEKRKLEGIRQKAGLPEGFGRFETSDLGLDRDATQIERARYNLDPQGEVAGSRPIKEETKGREYTVPMDVHWTSSNQGKQEQKQEEEQPKFSFVPPPPSQSSLFQFASPRKSPPVTSSYNPLAEFATASSGTSTPRRAAAANALTGLQTQSPPDANEHPPSSLSAENPPDSTRSKRQRKRSRLALEEEEDNYSERDADGSSDEYKEDEDDVASFAPAKKASGGGAGEESDESYHSSSNATTPAASSSSRRAGGGNTSTAPAPKRRRRAPAAGASTSGGRGGKPNAKGSIACDHVSADGDRCGVVFRRPYDLARHKETIHGVTMGGEKLPPGKAKEWKCKECGGTFSRKDALLRHGRIRGHKPGV